MERKIIMSIFGLLVCFVVTHLLALLQYWQSSNVVDARQEQSYESDEALVQQTKRLPKVRQETVAGLLAEQGAEYEKTLAYRQRAAQECHSNTTCAVVYGNRGTSLGYLGQSLEDAQQQRAQWEEALQYLNQSLELDSSERIEHNKAVIEEWLKQQEDQKEGEQSDQSEQQQQDAQDGEEGESDEGGDAEEGDSEESESEGGDEIGDDQQTGSQQQQSSLSEYQKQQLEQYQEQLERNEQNNQQFFAPTGQQVQQQSFSPFDQLFGNGLQKQLPNSEGVKDR